MSRKKHRGDKKLNPVLADNRDKWIELGKKGISPNPAGRPMGSKNTPKSHLKRLLMQTPSEEHLKLLRDKGYLQKDNVTNNAEVVALTVFDLAVNGDMDAVREIFKQTDLSAAEEHKLLNGGPEGNVQFNIVYTALGRAGGFGKDVCNELIQLVRPSGDPGRDGDIPVPAIPE